MQVSNDAMPTSAHALQVGSNLDIQGRHSHLRGSIPESKRPTDVSCRPCRSILDTSRKYSLIFSANEPAALCSGLQKEKSDYVGFNQSEILWKRPFGASLQVYQSAFAIALRDNSTHALPCSTLFCPTSDANVTITLRQHRGLHSSQNIGTCIVDCPVHPGMQSE